MRFGPLKRFKPFSLRCRIQGFTLIEATLAIMILAILSIGVSSLVRTGVETQMSRRIQEYMQAIGLNIVDDLRRDLRTADQAVITNAGNRLTITAPGGNIVYNLEADNTFTRTEGGVTKIYNDPNLYNPWPEVVCLNAGAAAPCFSGFRKDLNNPGVMVANNASPQQVMLADITVRQAVAAGGGTVIDNAFGMANFSVRNITLSLTSQTDFR
jgi:prepilin-type N-terminal cleavage/methylation domain-containing protein